MRFLLPKHPDGRKIKILFPQRLTNFFNFAHTLTNLVSYVIFFKMPFRSSTHYPRRRSHLLARWRRRLTLYAVSKKSAYLSQMPCAFDLIWVLFFGKWVIFHPCELVHCVTLGTFACDEKKSFSTLIQCALDLHEAWVKLPKSDEAAKSNHCTMLGAYKAIEDFDFECVRFFGQTPVP